MSSSNPNTNCPFPVNQIPNGSNSLTVAEHFPDIRLNANGVPWLDLWTVCAAAIREALEQQQAELEALREDAKHLNDAIAGWKSAAITLGLEPDALNVWRNVRAESAESKLAEVVKVLGEHTVLHCKADGALEAQARTQEPTNVRLNAVQNPQWDTNGTASNSTQARAGQELDSKR